MKLKYFLLFSFVLISAQLLAADDNVSYETKKIKPELLVKANAVIRDYSLQIDINSLNNVLVTEHIAITVLNEKGDEYANWQEDFSQLKKIKSISGNLYDADGDKIKKIKSSDFIELPMYINNPTYADDKIKRYKVNYRKYPYTVEYDVVSRQNHTFHLPAWEPQEGDHCAVEKATLIVHTDSSMIKYRAFKIGAEPEINAAKTSYTWHIADVPAHVTEFLGYEDEFSRPTVLLAMPQFKLGDSLGNANDWNNYGKFIYELNKGRDILPEDIKNKVAQITSGITDEHEKVKLLYSYMQGVTRYVAVEYGVGGWQTLDAAFLAKNQYGDCKALSNYMMSLLKAAGVNAYPVIIYAGVENKHKMITDFVCTQFNHEILCVPFKNDTIWLECTSADLPANYLSDFTQNRNALMITPAGGIVVHTPIYDASVNLSKHITQITYNKDGSVKIDMHNRYTGQNAEYVYLKLKYENDHDKQEYINSKFHLNGYTVNDYKYERSDAAQMLAINENSSITATGMSSKTGDRIFINMDAIPVHIPDVETESERKTSFYLSESHTVCDTFELTMPEKCSMEHIPDAVSETYSFGSYSLSFTKTDDKIFMYRKFALNSGVYDAALFEKYAKLIDLVNNESRKKVVFKSL